MCAQGTDNESGQPRPGGRCLKTVVPISSSWHKQSTGSNDGVGQRRSQYVCACSEEIKMSQPCTAEEEEEENVKAVVPVLWSTKEPHPEHKINIKTVGGSPALVLT